MLHCIQHGPLTMTTTHVENEIVLRFSGATRLSAYNI